MENRQYMIFSVSEANLINFNEVLQNSDETLRKSNDNNKALVKWESMIVTDSADPSLNRPALDENGQIAGLESTPPTIVPEIYIPESISALTTKEGPYTHEEILVILAGPDWTDPNPIS